LLNTTELRRRLINCNYQKTKKVPIHKKPPYLLAGQKACPRKSDQKKEIGREEGRHSESALYMYHESLC